MTSNFADFMWHRMTPVFSLHVTLKRVLVLCSQLFIAKQTALVFVFFFIPPTAKYVDHFQRVKKKY